MQHQFYTDKDADVPHAICDGAGSVAMSLCKVCGQAEGELQDTCPGTPQEQVLGNIRAKAREEQQQSDHDRINDEGAQRLHEALSTAGNVRPMPTRAPATPSGPPTLKLGEINARLAPLGITAEGLVQLGFPVVSTSGAAKLWHEHQFDGICDAVIARAQRAKAKRQQEAA